MSTPTHNLPRTRVSAFCWVALERSTRIERPTSWSWKELSHYSLIVFHCIPDTTPKQIEECFKKFLRRPDIVIILINQVYADMIRPTVDAHNLAVPTVLEIPSKQHPYDSSRDSILKRAQRVITPPERHY
uniref:V-type proton ATPase subunit F 2 n=1 Tax=Drosophila melanogaster TaxID=7227 RepID=VATF2_DROME|nr:vacuolar H[+] ATPase 14kD subunit 2, isoform A [Drosophila melanogaster]Q9VNL3.2 RecName: Full=V-type proton ATPase subunit F 2; Short=V-ATPase subunit F 2; AltName: Full=Vacuolar H+ ATPase subunit 14-2; AltName: Full=Vacuolar proton pump subunit F 2 [Drosophila melanogaster]AAF51917.2 vacuolar H[+] ATPase 14kD subunit 2, isoform A [Drosophila melanogaster]|eukprot:NP_649614.1 vacuolar H[+] ATPase 14kD subunit 2, isoform A [Drosophila melanogaster]